MAVGVATSAILARNLGADDYGVVGIAMIVIGFLGRFSDIGMTAALVQRPRIDERVLETAQTLNLILAAVLFACALAAAPFMAVVFKNYAVPQVVSVLACSLLISAIGFLPSALLTREMRFAALRIPFVTGAVALDYFAYRIGLNAGLLADSRYCSGVMCPDGLEVLESSHGYISWHANDRPSIEGRPTDQSEMVG